MSIKQNLLKNAMRAMSHPSVQKVMSDERTQQVFARAFRASYEAKTRIDDTKSKIAQNLNLATSDDLRTMKRELDRLQRQVERLKKEKEQAQAAAAAQQDGGEG